LGAGGGIGLPPAINTWEAEERVMGLKRNDGCLAKVADDEPIFVLRAQDRLAPGLIRRWADLAETYGCPAGKVKEARELALQMEEWAQVQGRGKFPD
jgi:hypothetical protein